VKQSVTAWVTAFLLLGCGDAVPLRPQPGLCPVGYGLWMGAQAAVTFSYDDGTLSQITYAVPQLADHGLVGSFNLVGSIIDQGVNGRTWQMWRDVAAAGHEIGNHTYNHANLTAVSLDSARYEIERGYKAILDSMGIAADTFVYPFGASNQAVRNIASEQHASARGAGGINALDIPDPYLIRSFSVQPASYEGYIAGIDSAIALGGWVVLVFHGFELNPTNPYNCRPSTHDSIAAYVEAKGDTLWCATQAQVFAHTQIRSGVYQCWATRPGR
jgi:peptidoglycan/xylan/chitin deacetylase (PgdA/CDA1 family)